MRRPFIITGALLLICAYTRFIFFTYNYESQSAAKAAAIPQSGPKCPGCAYTSSAPTHVHQFTQVILPTAWDVVGIPGVIGFFVGLTLIQKWKKDQQALA
jgi:hypothetical protein